MKLTYTQGAISIIWKWTTLKKCCTQLTQWMGCWISLNKWDGGYFSQWTELWILMQWMAFYGYWLDWGDFNIYWFTGRVCHQHLGTQKWTPVNGFPAKQRPRRSCKKHRRISSLESRLHWYLDTNNAHLWCHSWLIHCDINLWVANPKTRWSKRHSQS